MDYFVSKWKTSNSGRVVCMCYKWHCCNMCMVAKFRSVWYLSSPTSLTNVAKPRSITLETCILFSHTLVQSIKKNEENVRNSTVADCFSSGIIWCAAFIVRNKFEQLTKEGSRFIFSILYFSGVIAIPHFFQIKENLAFLAIHRLISYAKSISEIVQLTTKALN